MTTINSIDRDFKNFEVLALQFSTFLDKKTTTFPSKKFFIKQLIWFYDRVFRLIFSKYFFDLLKDNEINSPNNKSELPFDGNTKTFEFSMKNFHEFSEDISKIQKFWSTVKSSLFTQNYKDFLVRGDFEEDLSLSDQLSILIYEKEPKFRKHPDGISLLKNEIMNLLANANQEVEQTRNLYFLRKDFLNTFFRMKADGPTQMGLLCFLINIDQQILLTLSDFVIFSENFCLLTLRFDQYFYTKKFETEFQKIQMSLKDLQKAIDSFESENN